MSPRALAALGKELGLARGHDAALDDAIDQCGQVGATALSPDALGRRGPPSNGSP
ncbi:MAG: hypothetical protein ABIU87_04515 [Ornithinibacter sp.]